MSILEPFKVFMDSEAFINKVNKIVDTTTDADTTNMRLRRKEWSLFLSEIFPIKTLLEAKRNRWAGIKIKMFLDKAAGPDAEIEGLQNIKYLEITEVGFDTYELYSMQKMNRSHYGLPASPDRETESLRAVIDSDEPYFEFYSCDERYEKSIKAITTRISYKKEKYARTRNNEALPHDSGDFFFKNFLQKILSVCTKSLYFLGGILLHPLPCGSGIWRKSNKTALLVSFDDYGRLGRADDNDDFRNLLEKSKIEKGPFVNIFVVGRGKNSLYLEL